MNKLEVLNRFSALIISWLYFSLSITRTNMELSCERRFNLNNIKTDKHFKLKTYSLTYYKNAAPLSL